MTRLAFTLIALLPSFAFSQEVGSVEAYRIQAEIANRALMDEAQWNAAKKLSVTPLLGKGKKPPGGDTPPEMAKEGEHVALHYWAFRVLDVIDARNVTLIVGDKVIWLEDYPTDGLASDDKVYLASPVKLSGTKEYQSLSGAKRVVRTFKFVPREEIEKELAERAKEEEAKEWPEWRSTAGTSIKAKFIGVAGSGVLLQTKDGKKLNVQLSKFVDEDKEKLRELMKEWKAKNKK